MFKNAQVHPGVCNPDEYHAQKEQRGTPEFAVSPSFLKTFGQCPSRCIKGYNPPASSSKDWGSLLDCYVLTPDLLDYRFAIEPATYTNEKGESKKWNNNATACKEWRASVGNREIVSQHEIDRALEAFKQLIDDETSFRFIQDSDKQVLVTAEWHDEDTGLVIPVRCLIDLVPRKDSEFAKCLGDLKTTRTAALQPFSRDVHKFGHHLQAAFDTDIYVSATGEDRNTWCLIIQESYEPWQVGKRILSQDFMELGRAEYKRLLKLYCQCLKSGFWPGYDDHDEAVQQWSICNPEPWMSSEAMFAPKFEQPEPTETEEQFDTIP